MQSKQQLSTEKMSGHSPKGDAITLLPIDKVPPSHSDVQMIDQLFPQKPSILSRFCSFLQLPFILAIVFLVIEFPQVKVILWNIIPTSKRSVYNLWILKTILATVICYSLIRVTHITIK